MPTEPISTEGTILSIYHECAYRVSLKNGKEVIAHSAKKLAIKGVEFSPGDLVSLELTPYDFEKARIVGPAAEKLA